MCYSQMFKEKKVIVTDQEYSVMEADHKVDAFKDEFTRRVLFTAQKLLETYDVRIDTNSTGVVLGTQTGPAGSMKEIGRAVKEHGYMGIMPLVFPNVMLSTSLFWLTKQLEIHGLSSAIYESSTEYKDSRDYAIMQILAGNCDSVVVIQADETGTMTGLYIRKSEENVV